MPKWRISKDRPEWAICPETPWTVAEWDPDEAVWGNRRKFATWPSAVEWLSGAWPVLGGESWAG